MNTAINKNKAFVRQRGQSDCGVACLLTILRLLEGDCSYDALKGWSGAGKNGISIEGIKVAAYRTGLKADAYKVNDLTDFKNEASFPCIIHVLNRQKLNHFVVCCGITKKGYYAIFDPAKGLEVWNENQLLTVWNSKAVLLFTPNNDFIKVVFD